MKKSLFILYAGALSVFGMAFTLMSSTNDNEGIQPDTYAAVSFIASDELPVDETTVDDETGLTFTQEDVWDHFNEKMSPKLQRFVSYDEGEIFSRCPSGLGQFFDETESYANIAMGEVVVWQGCSDVHYAYYKIDMNTKKTFLKIKEKDEFIAMADFIEIEKEKSIAKF